jgi:hypothetical protein
MRTRVEVGVAVQTSSIRTIASAALSGIVMFTVLLVLLHVLRTDLSPVKRMMSEYAVGDYGVLMTIAFLGMATACVGLIVGLLLAVPAEARSRIGLLLVTIWALGMVLFAAFPIGVGETVDTTSDLIHRGIAPLVFFALPVGVFLVSQGFKREAQWQNLYPPGIVVAVVLLVTSVGFFVSYGVELGIDGLFQRVFIVVFVVWFIVVASKIRATGAPQDSE